MGGQVVVHASGGDPLQARQLVTIFESFVEAGHRRGVAARRTEFGDEAQQHPLPRTGGQRRFDALLVIFAAAQASPDGHALPDVVVNVVVDADRVHDVLALGGVTLPGGRLLDLEDDGDLAAAQLARARLRRLLRDRRPTRVAEVHTSAATTKTG